MSWIVPPTPQPATDSRSLALATPLVLLVGVIHLLQGLTALVTSTSYPPLVIIAFLAFGVSAIGIVGGIETALLPPRAAYTLGVGLMVLAMAAYVEVHVIGVGTGTFGSESVSPVLILSSHLMADPVALLTKIMEFVTMILLSIAALRHGVEHEANR